MIDDITKVLQNWDYRLGRVDARRVKGDDGVDKLQLRIDLGLLQMNAQYRPDGKRPFGHPTLLDHFVNRLEEFRKKHGGEDDDFSINPDECAKLQQEAIQYHHRSICNFELEDFEAVERDTEHILELLDFVQDFAAQDDIGQSFQQFRPQTIMMQVRAVGTELIAENNYDAAIDEITNAIDDLNLFYTEMGREELIDRHDSPWDNADRRPSHANRRKALRRQILRNELSTITDTWSIPTKFIQLAKSLMALAT